MTRLISRFRGRARDADGTNGNGISHVRLAAPGGQSSSRARYVVTSAESAPCTCPDFCERDHDNE
jgi:hypothetical protein